MERTQRQFCLDMMKVSWVGTDGFKKSDCAIILEIEPSRRACPDYSRDSL